MGYKSVGINHLGDWGTQFGKLITAYKLWSSEEEVLKGGIAHMLDLLRPIYSKTAAYGHFGRDEPEFSWEAIDKAAALRAAAGL